MLHNHIFSLNLHLYTVSGHFTLKILIYSFKMFVIWFYIVHNHVINSTSHCYWKYEVTRGLGRPICLKFITHIPSKLIFYYFTDSVFILKFESTIQFEENCRKIIILNPAIFHFFIYFKTRWLES